jgi:hypothetical protein
MNEARSFAFTREGETAMPNDDKRQGIVLDEKAQEQPADKDRAQTATKTEKEDELQPLKEKSGF